MCQLSSIPDDINSAAIEDNGEAVTNRTANITVTKDEETTKYELNISDGEMTAEEKEDMTDSMKAACGNKEVEKITVKTATKDEFEKLAKGELLTLEVSNQRSRQSTTGCSKLKVRLFIMSYQG